VLRRFVPYRLLGECSPGIMWLRERTSKYDLVIFHDDEYPFCVRQSGKLNEDNGNGGRRRYQSGLLERSTKGTPELVIRLWHRYTM